jgi:hypothetical protein
VFLVRSERLSEAPTLLFRALPTISERSGKLVGFLTSESDRRSAVGKYDEEMKARAGEGLRTSVMNTTMFHDCKKVMTSPAFMRAGLKKATKMYSESPGYCS